MHHTWAVRHHLTSEAHFESQVLFIWDLWWTHGAGIRFAPSTSGSPTDHYCISAPYIPITAIAVCDRPNQQAFCHNLGPYFL